MYYKIFYNVINNNNNKLIVGKSIGNINYQLSKGF